MKVYIAWYHDGFYDNPSVKLGVFAGECAADEAIQNHKRTRDRSFEYKDRASWTTEECEVRE